ncbi:histidine kinase dimerization/phospho-acceptor domain-containing protein [Kineobactrum salinum]|uniref:histidine kinase dimerization/phospho-acceptor domain-containing protein n=1 Tax=Kineobactrum salinum TaxID=2708301 RepID=UPI001E58F71F|nr:histidine kinase dimerization/phospho-acceptor domain-containing protein [Kineobactrum salinum]
MRGGLRPLAALRDQLRRRTPENLDPVTVDRAPSELVPVVETLNELFNRVASSLAWEQRFANSAAHEFRTPLTAIKTHLHVASRVSGEPRRQALANAGKGVAQLQSVTEQLLLLSRLERNNAVASEGCLIDRAVEDVLEDLPGRERVRMENRCKEGRVALPRALVVVVLRNLIDNALKHSAGSCELILDCSDCEATAGGSHLRVTLRDRGGPGGSDSGSVSSESHGLGLPIVHMVVNQFGGSLVSEHNEAGGMDWQLALPLLSTG